ncbi:hypothetical protein Tco_0984604 [Tanacetum coccineum]
MSGPTELNLTPPTSDVRNTVRRDKGQTSKNPDRPAFDAALREYCDKHYHQLLPIIAEKVHNEKVQQEKLKEVKARLNFEGCLGRNSKIQETSQYSESRTLNKRGDLRRRLKPRRSCSTDESEEITNLTAAGLVRKLGPEPESVWSPPSRSDVGVTEEVIRGTVAAAITLISAASLLLSNRLCIAARDFPPVLTEAPEAP